MDKREVEKTLDTRKIDQFGLRKSPSISHGAMEIEKIPKNHNLGNHLPLMTGKLENPYLFLIFTTFFLGVQETQ